MDDQILNRKIQTFVDTYIWLTNIEHCAQSVRNVRVCCLVVRTRVCQMFPFTTNNPLGHTQSQRMFIFQYSVSHHYQMFLSTIYNPLGHPQSQKNVQSLIITTNNPIGHTQSKRMLSLSSLAGLTSPIQSSFCSCFHFPVTKKWERVNEYSESRLCLCAFGGIPIRERYIFLLCVNPSTLLTLRYPHLL